LCSRISSLSGSNGQWLRRSCQRRANRSRSSPHAARSEAWTAGYLFALAGPIYAGTNEIQRTVVAERLLGLPRGPR
jgi:alkylation response protein AidB-like acyl-CoA dehydrogenase